MFILFLILGLIVGSFLNAVIYRLHKNESFVKGRSKCPHCQHELGFFDLIPVLSFIFLKGKCRYCKKKISWQYPLVELASGFLFTLVYLYAPQFSDFARLASESLGESRRVFQSSEFLIQSSIYLLRNLFFVAVLILIFTYDFKYYLILPKVTVPAMLVALIFNLVLGFNFLNLLLSAVVLAGFFGAQFLISKGRWIGGGDIHYGALIGLMLGWPVSLVALILGYFLGGLIGIYLLSTKKKALKSEVPLATFLSVGAVIALLWGQAILDWYLDLTF